LIPTERTGRPHHRTFERIAKAEAASSQSLNAKATLYSSIEAQPFSTANGVPNIGPSEIGVEVP
jgi:hypothetical protein